MINFTVRDSIKARIVLILFLRQKNHFTKKNAQISFENKTIKYRYQEQVI